MGSQDSDATGDGRRAGGSLRRTVLRASAGIVGTSPASGLGFAADDAEWGAEDASDSRLPPDVEPKINEIVRPLHSAPTILTTEEPLYVELDTSTVDGPSGVEASLRPSFGDARDPVQLGTCTGRTDGESGLWPDGRVVRLEFELPDDAGLDGLYDVKVRWADDGADRNDSQRRAVDVVDEHTESPQVVVIADPSVGDPRPFQDAASALATQGDVEKAFEKINGSVGLTDGRVLSRTPVSSAALEQTLSEITLIRPDFVLVTGDLTFALHPRPAPYEYEDAYQLFDQVEVPTFYTPGNHDLYEVDGYAYHEDQREWDIWDVLGIPAEQIPTSPGELGAYQGDPYVYQGAEIWRRYFGPMHYSVDIANLHVVSINTFDWENQTAFQPGPTGTTHAGGQVRDGQLAWLREDLESHRASNPRSQIVTFAHHDPSWIEERHPWAGKNRLELRDLLAQYGVGAHFSGHTHEDRVARYHRGNVVQTNGRPHRGQPVGELSYMLRDDSIDRSSRWTQEQLGQILRQPRWGPLFVSTTTAASGLEGYDWGLGSYWGWRLADLTHTRQGGYDPIRFGYPASREFLDETAMRPENWNADHAEFGLFSYPSHFLSARTVEGNDRASTTAVVEIRSDLATGIGVTVRLSLRNTGEPVRASGGKIVRERRNAATIDLWVETEIPAESRQVVRASSGGEALLPDD